MDWTNPRVSESVEEEEAVMSGLVSGFVERMRKRGASAQGEIALGYELPCGKHSKLSDPDEEAQKSSTVINVDSIDRAFDAQSTLEGALEDASREACASLENGITAGGSPNAEGVVAEALLEVATDLSFSTRLISVGLRRPRMLG